MLFLTAVKESIIRCVLAYGLNIEAVSAIFTFVANPAKELLLFKSMLFLTAVNESIILCVLAYGLNIEAVSAIFTLVLLDPA